MRVLLYMLSYLTQLTSTCTDLVIAACRTMYMPATSTAYTTAYATPCTSTTGDVSVSAGIHAAMQYDNAELDEVSMLVCIYNYRYT